MSILRSLRQALAPSSPRAIHMPSILYAPEGALPIALRPLTTDDAREWGRVRWGNEAWLAPWESGDPEHGSGMSFNEWIQWQRQQERDGAGVVFAVTYQGCIVGQISLGAICYGAMRSGTVGYWMDHAYAGKGIMPLAVAMLADWALGEPSGPKLHRLEIDMLINNRRSHRVAEKVGATYEGVRRGYMYVNGRWQDHDAYSLLAEDRGEGFAVRQITRHARD